MADRCTWKGTRVLVLGKYPGGLGVGQFPQISVSVTLFQRFTELPCPTMRT